MNPLATLNTAEPAVHRTPALARHLLVATAWLVMPVGCHLGLSWIGFNPTDDGWLTSVARRLLDGEVPHRDFIFVRPALSAILNIPWVLWGGSYTIWLSRLAGWLCLAAIAWIWSGIFIAHSRRLLGTNSTAFATRYALYATVILLNAHTYPVMAWHSLDAMLLASVATACIGRGGRGFIRLAFLAAGAATLCRQNFACIIPVLMLCAPSSIRSLDFSWSFLPPALYFLVMLTLGAGQHFLVQVASTGGWFWETAITPYLLNGRFWTACGAGLLMSAFMSRPIHAVRKLVPWLPATTLVVVSISLAVFLWKSPNAYYQGAFMLAGFSLGSSLVVLTRFPERRDLRLTIIAGLGLAWVQTISVGYTSPALCSGILFGTIWVTLHSLAIDLPPAASARMTTAAMISLGIVGSAFVHARLTFPYRDRPADQCTFEVGDVFNGGANLRTGVLTYAVLKDLKDSCAKLRESGFRYAILTDFSAAWIRSAERNPLPVEWAQGTELAYNSALVGRVLDAIAALPNDYRVIVQRFQTSELHRGLVRVPPGSSYFAVQNWVQRHAQKVDETTFFEIYLPPRKNAPQP